MALLNFVRVDKESIFTWVHSAGDDDAPEPVWPGLWEMSYPEDRRVSPYFRFGINNGDGEGLAVWRSAAFAMCRGLTSLAIPSYHRDRAAAMLGRDREQVDLIEWEYEVDNENGDIERADKGFVPGRACVPMSPEPDEFQRRNRTRAGLFEVQSLDDFTALEIAVSGDVSSEVAVLAIDGSRDRDWVLASLRSDTRPRLDELLQPGECFVDVSIVRDRFLGQTSYLIMKSVNDLDDRVRAVAQHYNRAWDTYLRKVDTISTFEEFALAMEDLLAPPR